MKTDRVSGSRNIYVALRSIEDLARSGIQGVILNACLVDCSMGGNQSRMA